MPGKVLVGTSCAHGSQACLRVALDRHPRLEEQRLRGKRCAVDWVVSSADLEAALAAAPASRRLARIPGYANLCKKVLFARTMAGAGIDGWPETWCVPED